MGDPGFRSQLELYLITMTVISHIEIYRKMIGSIQVEQFTMRDALVRVCGMTADKNISDRYRLISAKVLIRLSYTYAITRQALLHRY